MPEYLEVRGAAEHNLRHIDVRIPLYRLTVLTGLSGSGKSSLAFNTIYAEGQRRFLETFSGYLRQFVGSLERPQVDQIENLPPVIAIEQKTVNRNPRSTVGTVTEIYDFLRLLYAKLGKPRGVGEDAVKDKDEIPGFIFQKYQGRKITVLAPLVKGRKGHYKELFVRWRKKGYTRMRIDGRITDLEDGLMLERYKIHDIELVVDSFKVTEKSRKRLQRAVETALQAGGDTLMIMDENSDIFHLGTGWTDPQSGISLPRPEPHFFSFNSPKGYCPVCRGLGEIPSPDPEKIMPDPSLSIAEGGLAPVDIAKHHWITEQIRLLGKVYGFDLNTPIGKIPKQALDKILHGFEETLEWHSDITGVSESHHVKFEGIYPILKKYYEQNEYKSLKRWAAGYMTSHVCPACGGKRLHREAFLFEIGGKNIGDLVEMEIKDLVRWVDNVESYFGEKEKKIAREIIKEIRTRLGFLMNVGLEYLTLNRSAATLSGGESQRIRLASQIGSQLVNVMYILDEPSIGLHPRDNEKLIHTLRQLRDLGNSIIVVEHDKEMMLAADRIIDLGPGAGSRGGLVVNEGNPETFMRHSSLTADYLAGRKSIPVPAKRREGNGRTLSLYGATGHNLKKVDLHLPLGKLIVVTGVSGSGKSTLVNKTLYPALRRHLHRSLDEPLPYHRIEGLEYIDKVVDIDQSPIGRTPRSNPATYIKVFDEIRKLFAKTVEAKIRGYKPGRFSFNVKGGRCPVCEGAGVETIEMNFLPNVYVTCKACQGKRFNRETLQIRYKGKNISDVLEMSVSEALRFFEHIPAIYRKLKVLEEIGLGYIRLGQPSTTLSGGEAQRIKLAAELSKRDTGKSLYILDEPTTGLHFEDIRMLLQILNRLVDKGNTVLIIEHNTDIIKSADHIIDLGPEGGAGGGRILFTGTPEEIIRQKNNATGRFLRKELEL
ncbi:MAG: excinuclease ABC subunit UvrA [Chlorobi bacterium]|nr:excinuclease ABC subunit UvrA [Chlorobiota bacterium]